jgi:diaminopimelate decarboxylase
MAMLKVVLESGIDIEVNSGGELFKALRVGFRPDQIIFNGTSKSDDESTTQCAPASTRSMSIQFTRSIWSNNRSSGCVHAVKMLLRRASRCASCLKSARARISVCKRAADFEVWDLVVRSARCVSSRAAKPDLVHVCGIHIHVGSQTPDVEPFAEAFKSMWEHLVTIHRETGHTLEHINLGGGIPVNYLRDRSQADQLPEHERDMLGADLEPSQCSAKRCASRANRLAP